MINVMSNAWGLEIGYGWIGLLIVFIVFIVVKKELDRKRRNANGQNYSLSNGQKFFR